jgi:hypothetical protein
VPGADGARGDVLRSDDPTLSPQASAEPRAARTGSDASDLLTPVVLSETERRFKFRGLPQAVGAARRALREWERHFQPDLFYDLSLCVSELVTGRVQQGAGHEIELAVRREQKLVRAEIADPRGEADLSRPPVTSPADWGMFIIDHVADRWGVDHGTGTLVWCEIDLASDRPQESPRQAQVRTLRRRER